MWFNSWTNILNTHIYILFILLFLFSCCMPQGVDRKQNMLGRGPLLRVCHHFRTNINVFQFFFISAYENIN